MAQQWRRRSVTRRQLLQTFAWSAAGLALAACSQASTSAPQPATAATSAQQPPAAAGGGTPDASKRLSGSTVRFGALANYKGDALEKTFPDFEKATGIKVQIDKLPDTNLSDKLTVSFASGSPDYDVSMMDEPWVPGLSSFLANVDELATRDGLDLKQYLPKALEAGVYNGQRVAMPLDPNVMMLWFRKDLLDAKSVQTPRDFNAIMDAAEKLNDPNGIAGISVAAKQDAQTSTTAILLLWNEGGDVITPDGKFGFDSPAGIKALETYQQLIKSAPSGVLGYGATEELDAFYTGKAAMVFYWASIGANATDPQKTRGADKVSWASVPNGMRGIWNLGIAKDSRNRDAAWEWVKWITGPEGSLLFTRYGGGNSPRYDVLHTDEFKQKFPWAPDLESAVAASRARPQTPNWNGIQTVIVDMTSGVLSGQKTPAEAVRTAAEQVAPYLKS
jgi:multiple sugar transport system substrate-binding protein